MKVKRLPSLIIVAVIMLLLASINSAKQSPLRLRFKPGATTASVTGQLSGWNDKAQYVVRLRAGQTMNLAVEGKCDECSPDVAVKSPAGARDTVDPDMCQCRVEVSNTAAGDYLITVGENRKGERWEGAFVLSIEVR